MASRDDDLLPPDDFSNTLSEALARIDTELNVVMAASDFLSVLSAAAQAPVLATLPTRMARRYAPTFGLNVTSVRLELRVPAVSMVWSKQADRDPGSAWLRGQIASVLASHTDAEPTQSKRRQRRVIATAAEGQPRKTTRRVPQR